MREFASQFYHSPAWRRCRAAYIAERVAADGGMCEECHTQPGYIVHHKHHVTPANIGNPDITLRNQNLEYVCKACHDKLHGYCNQSDRTVRCVFDADGNPVPAPIKPKEYQAK